MEMYTGKTKLSLPISNLILNEYEYKTSKTRGLIITPWFRQKNSKRLFKRIAQFKYIVEKGNDQTIDVDL